MTQQERLEAMKAAHEQHKRETDELFRDAVLTDATEASLMDRYEASMVTFRETVERLTAEARQSAEGVPRNRFGDR